MDAPKAHSRRGPVNQQPTDSPKMEMNLRNTANMPVGQDGQRDWSNNIFEYTDKGAGTYQQLISKTPRLCFR
jgi:hypothetical protein